MYYKNIIESKLLEIEAGRFQLLCNDLLELLRYGNVTNSGGQIGTDKTIVGTPDAYILLKEGKFIFIEYTTQQKNVYKKFYNDISKCINSEKTEVPLNKIDKIIVMFNSKLSVGELNQLLNMCADKSIDFVKYDIDNIASHLSKDFPFLALDYLGLAIDTGQFLNYSSFVKLNDSSMLATPLGLEIVGRENSIINLHRLIDSGKFIIVSGRSGIGKTKLVCESLKRYAEMNEKLGIWFIKDKGQGLYEELLRYVNVGQHLIFIDDINKQTHLDELLSYIDVNSNRIKVISTVREYALESVVDKVGKYIVPQVYNVDFLSNEVLIEIIENNFNIHNSAFQNQIVKLSKGNIRLAVMMAIVAKREKSLDSIISIGDILEKYYDFIKQRLEKINDIKILKALGALSFMDKLHIDSTKSLDVVIKITNIEKDELLNIYRALHFEEIVDIYENEVVVISEQIVSVFIFNYVFKVRGLLDYAIVLDVFFPEQKNRIIQNVNAVVSYYGNIDFFCDAVRQIWPIWEAGSRIRFRELALTFWFVKPEDTLIFIANELEQRPCNLQLYDVYEMDNQTEYDQLLSTLGQFSNDINNQSALDILLDYLAKDYSQIASVSKLLIDRFGYNIYSYKQGYQIQRTLINTIIRRLNNSDIFIQLFVNISSHLLSYAIEWTEATDNKSVNLYTVPLYNFGEMEFIHTIIWERCNYLMGNERYFKYIKNLLMRLGNNRRDSEDKTLYELEFSLINRYIITSIWLNDLELYSILFKIDSIYRRKLKKHFIELDEIESRAYQIYRLFKQNPYDYSDDWEAGKMKLEEKQIDFAYKLSSSEFTTFMDCCKQIVSIDDGYENSETMTRILLNTNSFVELVSTYLKADTPFRAQPSSIILRLIDEVGYEESYDFIMKYEFSMKEYWMYLLFSFVNIHTASEKIYNVLLYYFYHQESVSIGYFRNLDFLEYFKVFNINVVNEVVKSIFYKSDEFLKKIYLSSIFINQEKFEKLVSNFDDDLELLENIYLFLFAKNEIFDLDGLICRGFLKRNPDLLYKLVDVICENDSNRHYDYNGHFNFSIIWENEEHEIVKLIDYIIEKYIKYSFDNTLEPFFLVDKNDVSKEKVHLIIDEFINQYSNNEKKMSLIFNIIAHFGDEERVTHYLKFIEVNANIDSFQNLPFNKSMDSWSGSEIPILVNKKTFIEMLLFNLTDVKLLKHRAFLKRLIENYNARIKKTRINEFLHDY